MFSRVKLFFFFKLPVVDCGGRWTSSVMFSAGRCLPLLVTQYQRKGRWQKNKTPKRAGRLNYPQYRSLSIDTTYRRPSATDSLRLRECTHENDDAGREFPVVLK